jgi:NADPH-dependent 2,4-dienoyl-CoA reductase/sulfur reductase-like enzyme
MGGTLFDFEIVVIGAGPAGIAAACTAAENGARVALVDETPWLGGQIWRGQQSTVAEPKARRWLERFRGSGATALERTSIIAAPAPGLLLAEHELGPRQIRWQRLILATGARELFLPFPGWTLPAVMGPGGLQALSKSGWPIEGRRVIVAGSGPLLLAASDGLRKCGARVLCVAEQTPWSRLTRFAVRLCESPAKLRQAAGLQWRLRGVPYRCGVWPVRAEANGRGCTVELTNGRRSWTLECDVLACAFGLVANVELPLALGCELNEGFVRVDQWQQTSVGNIYCAGEVTGIGGVDCALVEGQIAGCAATGRQDRAQALFAARAAGHLFRSALATAFALRSELRSLATEDTLLCRCEDVPVGRVRQFSGWREAKLQSRCGMGACQGRVCGPAANVLFGWSVRSQRPPLLPARVQSLISQSVGRRE